MINAFPLILTTDTYRREVFLLDYHTISPFNGI